MSNVPDAEEEVVGVRAIFDGAARAVVGAQRRLDARAPERLSRRESDAQALVYSIPRVSLDVRFALRVTSQRRMLFVLRRRGRSVEQTHSLRFSLVASASAPAPLSGDPVATPFYLSEPHFLLPPDEETLRFGQLVAALADPRRRVFLLPDGRTLKPGELDDEIERLRFDFDKDKKFFEAMTSASRPRGDKSRERGLVFFRLDTSPPSVLVVRVTGKSKNDSVFVLLPGSDDAPPSVEVYSVEGDDTSSLQYRPMHLLGLAVRRWLEGAPPLRVRLGEGPPPALGLETLQDFALDLRDGYAGALDALSRLEDASDLPAFYDLTDVGAELTYSVSYDDDGGDELANPAFDFEGTDARHTNRLIQSRARVSALRGAGGAARLEIELAAPEFTLSGAARAQFLAFFDRARGAVFDRPIVEDLLVAVAERGESTEAYRRFLGEPSLRRSVVVLLSYKGQTPKEQFLVIWPGTNRAGRLQSFVFTCRKAKDDDELELTRWLMGVEDSTRSVRLDTPLARRLPAGVDARAAGDADLSEEQYQAFHNFFHAVRIWRARVSPRK